MSRAEEGGDPPVERNGHSRPDARLDSAPHAQQVVEDFMERLERGESPDADKVILAHPEIAAELEGRLEMVELIHSLAHESTLDDTDEADFERAASFLTGENGFAGQGRYTIRSILGRGATSVVYLAYDGKFGRDVALKVFRSDACDGPDSGERFERDARIAAHLRHPNIVPLHDTGQIDGARYIDTELIRGETLESRLQRSAVGPTDFRADAELVRKLAEALDYAHRAGIVHRDVKPSNILIDAQGEPQLTDFGLARHIGAAPTITVQGQILGTPAYMSPEQAEGQSHQADGRTDVYSLGVVFYRILSGRLPFETKGPFAELVAQIISVQPPTLRSVNPAIPKDLETICLKALEKRPADRFATAGALADELRRWLNQEPLTIRPPTWWERLRRWSRLNRVAARVAIGSALVLTVVSLGLGATAWNQALSAREARFRHATEARYRAEAEVRSLFEQARQRVRTPTEGRRWAAQDLLRQTAQPLSRIPEGPERAQLLEAFRSLFAATLAVPDLRSATEDILALPDVYYQAWPVAMHPDGKMIAIGTHLGPIRWDRGKKPEIPGNLDPKEPRPRLTYSPDGQYLAFAPEIGGLELWDGELTKVIATWKPYGAVKVMAMGFQGKTLWICGAAGQVQSLSLPELQPGAAWGLPKEHPPVTAAAFSSDSSRLAVGDENGRIQLLETTGRRLAGWPADRIEVTALAWSPDNRLLATGTEDGTVKLWEAEQGIPVHRWPAFPLKVGTILFDLDGRHVLAGSHAGDMKGWSVTTGHQVLTGPSPPWVLSRDGRTMTLGDPAWVRFVDLFAPQIVRPLPGHLARVARLAWSRNSRRMVTLDNRFDVRVWDVIRGSCIDEFHPPPGDFSASNAAVALSDDGRLVAYASGGGRKSRALIRDVMTDVTLANWELPGGYERMTYADGRFLLVREELDPDFGPGGGPRQSVTRELIAGKTPELLRVIRRAENAEERSFLTTKLTPDGRLYLWIGPRLSDGRRRVEVRDVSTGRSLRRFSYSTDLCSGQPGFSIDPEGRSLVIQFDFDETFSYDLADPQRQPGRVSVFAEESPTGHWFAPNVQRTSTNPTPGLTLRRRWENSNWLALYNVDLSEPLETQFSPDGRFLAWTSSDGTITVADLPALEREVSAFEQSTLAR